MLKCPTSTVLMTKEEFKYPNPTPTNTDVFCDKTSHLTDCASDNYQVRDNIEPDSRDGYEDGLGLARMDMRTGLDLQVNNLARKTKVRRRWVRTCSRII
ncbi:hypothetical protein DVH24_029934 [Malus domestica]|uniref:Uncharacterized protein n=1 Tax=Malus domestica TaxID=3750 RepID=A0A498I299_MALDO|nr:hypothetical protein DVH24_029934 [Malus domestica]